MEQQAIWIGSGKQVEGHDIINASICVSDIPKEHIKLFEKNGKKYLNITISKKRETDQYGKTHGIKINTWEPKQQEQPVAPQYTEPQQQTQAIQAPF